MQKRIKYVLVALSVFLGCQFVAAQVADPGLPGSHTVIKSEYNLGDLAYTPPSTVFPYSLEMRGSVHYPADLTSGPFPVIMILHGRHETCYDSVTLATTSEWPCTGTKKPIESYEGYDYAAQTMASHGYIVISISANAINASDGSVSSSFEDGMPARGYLMQHQLDLWNTWNTVGGYPGDSTLFVGKLNMQNIGTMGHSRGGEGVIFNAQLNASLGSPYGIKAILTLAPTDFYRHYINGIPLLDLAPYCDGDVNDLEGVHYYDDVRYNDTTDESPKHLLLMMGANHDFFNTVWTPGSYVAGGFDDWLYSYSNTAAWCGAGSATTGRFDTTTQKAAYNAYSAAFFRTYIGGETAFEPILQVNAITPPASSLLDSAQVYVSYHPGRTLRTDINRTDVTTDITTNTMSAAVTDSGLTIFDICGGGLTELACGLASAAAQEPHKGSPSQAGLSEMNIRWSSNGEWLQNDLASPYADLTSYESIMFRATVNYHNYTGTANLNFSVVLTDSLGDTASQVVSNFSNALFHQPGTQSGDLPKDIFNTIRIPLSGFFGVDLTKISSIRFLFNHSSTGAILISDMALLSTTCGRFQAAFNDSFVSGYHYNFIDSSVANYGDTLLRIWNFGDPASGSSDTTSMINPSHIFSGAGTYHVCLYIQSKRRNGTICTDTVCQDLIVTVPVSVNNLAGRNVSIAPNPAKDRITITGIAPGDQIILTDLCGSTILATTGQGNIILPGNLAPGIYYVSIVATNGYREVRKLLIER